MEKKTGDDLLANPGHSVTKRAASSRPAFRYKQPRRRKLEPTEQTFGTLRSLASRMCTQKEAAAILQVHVDTLQKFFRAYPEAREAWGEGKEIGAARSCAFFSGTKRSKTQLRPGSWRSKRPGLGIKITPAPPNWT